MLGTGELTAPVVRHEDPGETDPRADERVLREVLAEATPVGPPQTLCGDGLEIQESGHGGGWPGDIAGQYITRDARVDCVSDCSFGPGKDRQFWIDDLTTQTSLTFALE